MKRILFCFVLSLLTACFKVPEELVMPEWDTNLNLPLTNRTYNLDEILRADSHIKIDTIGGQQVYLITTDTMKYSFGIGEYLRNRLDQGFNDIQLNLQNGEASIDVELANSIELDSAHISKGDLNIDIINTGSTIIDFEVIFPDLYKSDGNNFKIRSSVPANGKSSSILDLSGCKYSASGLGDRSKLRIKGKVVSGGRTGLVKLNVSIKNSDFIYISGKMPMMEISQIEKSFELPITDAIKKFRDKFSLENSILTIESQYYTILNEPFGITVKNIKVYGIRDDGTTKYLEDESGNNNLGEMNISKNYLKRTFTNSNSNISEFLSYLPDSVIFKADVIVNPQNNRGEASSSDSVLINIQFNMSGEMAFNNIPYSDSVNLNFSNDNKKAIRNGREAILFLEITNAIPLEVGLDISFTDSTGNVLLNKNLLVQAADVNASGSLSNPSESISEITLDSAEVQRLAECQKMIYNLLISTSDNGTKVTIQPDNWIKLVSYFKLKYHVKFD